MTSIAQQSLAFYHYLCQNVVGTEETVKTKRMLHTVHDIFKRTAFVTTITSGSFGEGLEMKGSDEDNMYVSRNINIYESIDDKYDPKKINFIIDTDGTKPGFTKLKSSGCCMFRSQFIKAVCVKINNGFYLSNTLVKNLLLDGLGFGDKMIIHGPCISDTNGQIDSAFSLQSKTWITPASHWLQRAHNEWPCHDVKMKIVDCGVLFVPTGVKGSINEEFEWRISFSAGEKFLVYSFNHTQLLCYALMKILLKDIIERDSRCKSVLCSYYIKTVVFWVSEEQPLSMWRPDNLIPCFLRCFQRLIYCVKYSICPHYFIPENNMFENRIEGFVRHVLLENLYVLYSEGWQCLLISQQLLKFEPLTPIRIEFNSFQDHFIKIVNSKALFPYSKMAIDPILSEVGIKIGLYGVIHFLQYKSHNIKPYTVYGISKQSFHMAQTIQLTQQKGNKETYKRYNTCLSYLLLNTHHDAVSGWLMLASFFYKMKQYRLALNILLYSLSKCSPEKIQTPVWYDLMGREDWCMHTIAKQILSHRTWKSMGILPTVAKLCLNPVYFTPTSYLMPNELEMFLNYSCFEHINPVVFAHFLCFLCHYHLRDVRQYRSSLSNLYLTITDKYALSSVKGKYIANFLLGIALQVMRDI